MNGLIERVCQAATIAADEKEILLVPDGHTESKVGPFVLDAQGASEAIAEFTSHGVELPIDYGHETVSDSRAQACGWITGLRYEAGKGLVASVRWNADTREAIRAGKYQYISPVALMDANDRVKRIHSAALTNKPAIPSMKKVAAAEPVAVDPMVQKIAGLLGIDSKGDAASILNAIHEKCSGLLKEQVAVGELEKGVAAIEKQIACTTREMLGLKADANQIETFTALGKMLMTAVQNKQRDQELKAFIDPWVSNGTLQPDSRWSSDREFYEDVRGLAAIDRKLAEKMLLMRKAFCPPAGMSDDKRDRTEPAYSNRMGVIRKACSDYESDEALQRTTKLGLFINMRLVESGLDTIKANETSEMPERFHRHAFI